jgi:nucleoside-diphosphate-sugar epimerase
VGDVINQLTGNPADIEFLAARPWDRSGKRFGSPEKAKREIGFQTRVLLSDGLSMTVEWTRKNLERIDRCIQQHDFQMKALS